MDRGGKGKTAIPEEEKADEPSILPMTPESKQLAAVIATAVATAMAGRSATSCFSSDVTRPGAEGGGVWAQHAAAGKKKERSFGAF